eukprot:CAMPEP_0114286638 /NCGR_PEP_ID=MMETSP0059-20121206/5858_1 /TAXON_ID=36894 /ORGANISM="Pyramimonas parkeae, Strain CCMP726" /LENGTH=256 /DNA_ID=CAMNT_0001407679 /DNA_START=43 /DNA_END=813 /DNA_ORIENTATION=-
MATVTLKPVVVLSKVQFNSGNHRTRSSLPRGCNVRCLEVTCNTDLMNVGQQIRRKAIASVAALSLVATCHALPVDAKDLSSRSRGGPGGTEGMAAVAELVSMEGYDVKGTVTFTDTINKYGRNFTKIEVQASGLTPGSHGFNIHEGVDGAGASFNPEGRPHGSKESVKKFGASVGHYMGDGILWWRHVGDLGNIKANMDGVVSVSFEDELAKLYGENSIVGKSIVIHADKDDFETELNDGNAGPIVAFGTIKSVGK